MGRAGEMSDDRNPPASPRCCLRPLSPQTAGMKVTVLVTHLCLTLCDSVDWRPPGSSAHGILHAGILKWVAIPFARGSAHLGIEP